MSVYFLGEGVGDLSIKAIVDSVILSETYSIQDVFVYRPTEVVITGDAEYNLITSTAISNTPNAFELEVDLKTTGAGSGAEDRLFLTSSSSWTGSTQPNPSVFIGFNHKFQAGTRTSSTSATDYGTRELNTYYTFKIIRSGNSWTFKVNDYTITTKTLTLSNNNIVLGGVSWNTGALSVKNLKIKPL